MLPPPSRLHTRVLAFGVYGPVILGEVAVPIQCFLGAAIVLAAKYMTHPSPEGKGLTSGAQTSAVG